MGTSYKELKHLRLSVDGNATPDSHREIACLETSSFSATANCVSPFSLRKATSFSFHSFGLAYDLTIGGSYFTATGHS